MGAQKEPSRVPNRSPKAIRAENGDKKKKRKIWFFKGFSLIFEVLGSLLGVQSGFKMGDELHLRRGRPENASWRPLGAAWLAWGASRCHLGGSWRPFGVILCDLGRPWVDLRAISGHFGTHLEAKNVDVSLVLVGFR